MLHRFVGVIAAVFAIGLAPTASAAPRIVGGLPAAADEFPFEVGLKIALKNTGDDGPDSLCAGSLIAARWVLTVAHCLVTDSIDAEHSVAIIGTTNLETANDAQRYGFAEYRADPGYLTGSGGHDVGLIRLDRPAPQRQLRLLRPDEPQLYAPGVGATAVGWGFTEDPADGGTLSPMELRKVDLRIYDDAECANAFGDQAAQLDFNTELCALSPGKDACNGDSGGPLLVPDPTTGGVALAGAVSFGIGNGDLLEGDRSCNEGPPGVYSRLGGTTLNDYVRSIVPQVEIATVRRPVAGHRVTIKALPRAPDGNGRFGGYDHLSWDLDGDGSFDDAEDRTTVRPVYRAGVQTIAVLATTKAGDAEVRVTRLKVRNATRLSFTRRSYRPRAGFVDVGVRRAGRGGGSFRLTVRSPAHQARLRLRYAGPGKVVHVAVPLKRFGTQGVARLSLDSFTGALTPGRRTEAKVYLR